MMLPSKTRRFGIAIRNLDQAAIGLGLPTFYNLGVLGIWCSRIGVLQGTEVGLGYYHGISALEFESIAQIFGRLRHNARQEPMNGRYMPRPSGGRWHSSPVQFVLDTPDGRDAVRLDFPEDALQALCELAGCTLPLRR